MKTIILAFLMMAAMTSSAQNYSRNGNVFTQFSVKKDAGQQTPYTFTDNKGVNYPIYITEKGRCYINKISSKTGKEYKYYLKEDICITICRELGRTYIPNNKK